MENLPLISVIIPVYRAEEYLDKCFQSVVGQTYRNLEIMLIDDGSPGNSGAICDEWARKDDRIVVIHKENGGSASARNLALDRANGQLITFVDCDDYLAPDMYQYLYSLMDEQTDIVECEYEMVYDDNAVFNQGGDEVMACTPVEAMRYNIRDTAFRQIVWNKLYRRETIGEIRLPDGTRNDDEFFTYQVVGRARKLIHSSRQLYAYRQQPDSVMHQNFTLKNLEGIQAHGVRLEYLRQNMPELVYEGRVGLLFACIYAMQMSLRFLKGEKLETARRMIHQTVSEVTPLRPSSKNTFKGNVWLVLAQISFEGTCRLQNWIESAAR